jgi:hypothetical protein
MIILKIWFFFGIFHPVNNLVVPINEWLILLSKKWLPFKFSQTSINMFQNPQASKAFFSSLCRLLISYFALPMPEEAWIEPSTLEWYGKGPTTALLLLAIKTVLKFCLNWHWHLGAKINNISLNLKTQFSKQLVWYF